MDKTELDTAFAAIAENDRKILAEARSLAETYKAAMDDLATRAGYGVIHESATLNVVHSARQQAEGTLAAIETVQREYPGPAAAATPRA